LAHGFARVRCEGCREEMLVAFSCKGRGVCPSCNAKRAHVTAAHLVEQGLPQVPSRQWTLSWWYATASCACWRIGVPYPEKAQRTRGRRTRRPACSSTCVGRGLGRAVSASEGAPVGLSQGLQPARKHAPARQRQAVPGGAVPVWGARCLGAGALRGGGGRAHRLPNEAAPAGGHPAPTLHWDGTAPLPDPLGAPPRMNLTRLHGVFAPGAKRRPFRVPAAAVPGEQEALWAATSDEKRQRAPGLAGAGLLKRTFQGDVFCCPKCAGRWRVRACLPEGAVLRRILRRLHLPPPRAPARRAPQQALWDRGRSARRSSASRTHGLRTAAVRLKPVGQDFLPALRLAHGVSPALLAPALTPLRPPNRGPVLPSGVSSK